MIQWILKTLSKKHFSTEETLAAIHPFSGPSPIQGDHPINSVTDDLIGRAPSARSFSSHILKLDARNGLVVGVLGPWGSGKTSFINLARLNLAETGMVVLDFNPWMFSGAEQLVSAFFDEVSSQLKLRPNLAAAGESLESYGDALSGLDWIPVAGTWIKAIGNLIKFAAGRIRKKDRGLGGRRRKVEEALGSLSQPIVVIIDDIDRLTATEIRDIFKLVRLTANFPNVIYILVFDRTRVEAALNEEGFKGRSYLEKILQLAVDLPAVPEPIMQRQIFAAIDKSLATITDQGPFDENRWPDVFIEIVRPLVGNMRDVRRYATAIHGSVSSLEGQIELVDVLAIEGVRVFLPDAFAKLHASLSILTTLKSSRGRDNEEGRQQIDEIIALATPHETVMRSFISRIFPAAEHYVGGTFYSSGFERTWLKDRRLAHVDMLRLYLERIAGESLQAHFDAERVFALLSDKEALDRYLRSLDRSRLEDVIAALELHEDDFTQAQVIPAVTVLLNLMPDIPERPRGFLELDTHLVVGRVLYRILKVLDGSAEAESIVRSILPDLSTLSAKLELIGDVGHQEGRGHKFVSAEVAHELEREWRAEVRSATLEALIAEHELLQVLLIAKKHAVDGEDTIEVPNVPDLTLALLRSSKSEAKSQAFGSRAITRSPRLAWKALIEIFGSEEKLRESIETVRPLVDSDPLIQLADKYLAGWNPDRFDN